MYLREDSKTRSRAAQSRRQARGSPAGYWPSPRQRDRDPPGAPPCSRIASTRSPILRPAQSLGTNPLRVVAVSTDSLNRKTRRSPR